MTEERFTELVNLYLDNEISEKCLAELKADLFRSPSHKAEFLERCRLHQAMQQVLGPEPSMGPHGPARRSLPSKTWRIGNLQSNFSRSHRGGVDEERVVVGRSNHLEHAGQQVCQSFPISRWLVGTALAATFLIAFFAWPLATDSLTDAKLKGPAGATAEYFFEKDPLDESGPAEFRRFAIIQERQATNRRASFAAQLRLMGLQPELTPHQKRLRTVSLDSVQPEHKGQSQAQLLEMVREIRPIPAPAILGYDSDFKRSAVSLPAGFTSSLTSFK